jgi:predicted DNA-binding transcriptional regulator AlpA
MSALASLSVPQSAAAVIPDRTYTAEDLARIFGVSKQTILNWHQTGEIPKGIRLANTLRWTPADVASILTAREG